MTLPGRGPKTPEERQADAIRSQPTRSGDGLILTRGQGKRAEIQPQRAPTGGGGVVCTAQFIAGNLGATFGAVPWGAEFSTLTGDGDSALFDSLYTIVPISGSQNSVHILTSGWYEMACYAVMGGVTTGDVARIEATQLGAMKCIGNGVYIPSSGLIAAGSSAPFFVYTSDLPVQVLLVVYGSAGGYVTESSLFISKIDGADVN